MGLIAAALSQGDRQRLALQRHDRRLTRLLQQAQADTAASGTASARDDTQQEQEPAADTSEVVRANLNYLMYALCSIFVPSFLVCDVSVSLYSFTTVCLHSLTLHDTSLTIIFPSINHPLTQYSHYLLQYTGTEPR
jgi:hypothetical protein